MCRSRRTKAASMDDERIRVAKRRQVSSWYAKEDGRETERRAHSFA